MNTNINENVINTRRNNRIIKHNDAVYKVFNEGYSKEDVFAEAFFTSKIEGLKVGAPSIEQVTTINGQWAFMYPDIYGESLYTLISLLKFRLIFIVRNYLIFQFRSRN